MPHVASFKAARTCLREARQDGALQRAHKLVPVVPSDLVMDCFDLARDIRALDMRAAPYDLSALGYEPVRIETPDGKAEYVRLQRTYAERGHVLRQHLLSAMDLILNSPSRPR